MNKKTYRTLGVSAILFFIFYILFYFVIGILRFLNTSDFRWLISIPFDEILFILPVLIVGVLLLSFGKGRHKMSKLSDWAARFVIVATILAILLPILLVPVGMFKFTLGYDWIILLSGCFLLAYPFVILALILLIVAIYKK